MPVLTEGLRRHLDEDDAWSAWNPKLGAALQPYFTGGEEVRE